MNEAYRHPHADLILMWAKQKASGEIDAGWWNWEHRSDPGESAWGPIYSHSPAFLPGAKYRYTMTDKHPANKPRTITVTIPRPEETGVFKIAQKSVQVVFSSPQDRILAFNAIRAALDPQASEVT